MNEQVDNYLQNLSQPWQAEICQKLRSIIQQAVPDADEQWKWGKPLYKKNDKYLCDYAAAKAWVNFRILSGRGLTPPSKDYEVATDGSGLSLKIKEGQVVDYQALETLLTQAAAAL